MSQISVSASPCQMMNSFSGCASLSAVLSAFENLKVRYNAVKKENKHLRERVAKYEGVHRGSSKKVEEQLPEPSKRATARMNQKLVRTKPCVAASSEADVPTVHSIVASISDQLIIIGHQLDSLLLDFDKIETKDEVYQVQETVRTVLLPRLVEIRRKEIESVYHNDQVVSKDNEPKFVKKTSKDLPANCSQDETATENLLRLQRLLKKQNVMLKNLGCFINEGEHLLCAAIPRDGWSLLT